MARRHHSADEILAAIRQADAGTPVADVCRELGITKRTFESWRRRQRVNDDATMERVRRLEKEMRELRRLTAILSNDKKELTQLLRDALARPNASESRLNLGTHARDALRQGASTAARAIDSVGAGTIVARTVAVLLAVALWSYSSDSVPETVGGRLGWTLTQYAQRALGLASFAVPVAIWLWYPPRSSRLAPRLSTRRLGIVCSAVIFPLLIDLVTADASGGTRCGWIGALLHTMVRDPIGLSVTLIALAAGAVIGLTRVMRGAPADRTTDRPKRPIARRLPVAHPTRMDPPPKPIQPGGNRRVIATGKRVNGRWQVRTSVWRYLQAERSPKSSADDRHDSPPNEYRLPAPSLLQDRTQPPPEIDEATLHASSRILESKLSDFGVSGKVVVVQPGPVVTTFEFEPEPGTKVARIVTLADDLMLALRVESVRIVAPIPGRPVIGIEVANPRRDRVILREVLHSHAFTSAESKLTVAVGQNTTGAIVVADLARMPHLLIGGTSGTDISASVHSILMSILFKAAPGDVRILLIQPNRLKPSPYEGIPHLLVPVVSDSNLAATALANLVREMENRHRLVNEKGVPEPHLPRIVVIIDELAELMNGAGPGIEESIVRLALNGATAGLHLVLATQQPTGDVVTDRLKANLLARISFRVTSSTSSRLLLDRVGAERLLDDGDMLCLTPGTPHLLRLNAPVVSDADVDNVVAFVKQQEQPRFSLEFLDRRSTEDESVDEDDDVSSDEMYDSAVRLVTAERQASISFLQRQLRVGYNRAARMIERMEREQIVSPLVDGGPRQVIARPKKRRAT